MREILEECDCVFHLAAQVAVTTSVQNPLDDFNTNIVGTFKLLENIRKSNKKPVLIYASTNKVYGNLSEVKIIKNSEIGEYGYEELTGIDETRNKLKFLNVCRFIVSSNFCKKGLFSLKTTTTEKNTLFMVIVYGLIRKLNFIKKG